MKMEKSVLLGMSGGVDSSVAALLLQKSGYKVVGAFMKNFSDNKNELTGECNWIEEKKMAQKISSLLKIPLVTIDYEKQYKKSVISPMFESYKKGKTPNPDILCNKIIKFPALLKKAKEIGINYIATGHYARIKKDSQGFHLLTGKDKGKDQSYFLSELSQKDLERTLFPLGNFKKEEVRKIAKENKFPNWDKRGTSGVCFIGKTDFKSFLERKIKKRKGSVLSPEGKKIGTHNGIQYYTIGEKVSPNKGIIISKEGAEQKKYYIAEKKMNNILVVAPEGHQLLKKSIITIGRIHLINPKNQLKKSLKVKIRHLGKLYSCILLKRKNKSMLKLSKPLEGIAPGQRAVIYSGAEIMGSCEIKSAE